MQILNGSTPTVVFLMVATSDHIAGLTGITPTVNISKGGGAGAASTNAASAVDATNLPGQYKLALTATETNTNGAISFHATGTGADPADWIDQVVAFNPADGVRLGLTALPNAAAEAAGGLYTRGTGAGQINQANNGNVDANAVRLGGTTQTGRDVGASVLLSTGTGTGQLDFTSGVVKANLAQILGTALTETAGQLAAGFKQFFNIGSPTSTMNLITATTTAANLTTNNDKTGYTLTVTPPTAATISVAVVDQALSGHTTAGTVGAALSAASSAGDPWSTAIPGAYGAGTAGNIVGNNVNASASAIKAKTDLIPASPAAVGSAMTLDLTQAVPTTNTAQTVGDALNAARAQGFGKWALTGTTLRLYANDATTVVHTFTLDSSTAPTSRT